MWISRIRSIKLVPVVNSPVTHETDTPRLFEVIGIIGQWETKKTDSCKM